MEHWESYFFQPKKIDEILDNATVVVDTNVLLSAYQWREVTVNEVVNILKTLDSQNRLKIPHHVIKEFSKRRPKEIIQRINEIENFISNLKKPRTLNQMVPMLEGSTVFEKVSVLQENYAKSLKEYREGLVEIRERLKSLFKYDPILENIKEIFINSSHSPATLEGEETLKKRAKERFANKIPPGYKDSKKEENSEGDYIIWANILELETDVIFLSSDKKIDWAYTDKHNNMVDVRRELVEEFYRETNGKTFTMINTKNFIKLMKPNISEEIIEDLDPKIDFNYYYDYLKPRHYNNILKSINNILNGFDPISIASSEENEYDIEAREILELFPKIKSESEMLNGIRKIFVDMFGDIYGTSHADLAPIARVLYELKQFLDKYNEGR